MFFGGFINENGVFHPPHVCQHNSQGRCESGGPAACHGYADYSTTANIYTHLDQNSLVSAIGSVDVTNTLLTNQKSA